MRVIGSIGRSGERFRGHEAFKTAALGVQLTPVVESKIDDRKAGRRQFLPQPFTRFDVAGRDQHGCEFVETGIVPDDQKRVRGRGGFLDDAKDCMSGRVIKPINRGSLGRRAECGGRKFPGLLSARGGRRHNLVGNECVGGQVGADPGGVLAPALHQFAGTVFHARFGAFGLGVTK